MKNKLRKYEGDGEDAEYAQARARMLRNYKKKEMERKALLDLIEEGVIFEDTDPDLKYLRQLKKKYDLNID